MSQKKRTWENVWRENNNNLSKHVKEIWVVFTCWLLWVMLLLTLVSKKAMAPHCSTLAWKIPWTEEPGRLQSVGSLGVGHDWATSLSLFTCMHWRRKRQPTPVFLPGESLGWGSLVGCCPWGRRVGHGWSNLAAAAATLVYKYLLEISASILLCIKYQEYTYI